YVISALHQGSVRSASVSKATALTKSHRRRPRPRTSQWCAAVVRFPSRTCPTAKASKTRLEAVSQGHHGLIVAARAASTIPKAPVAIGRQQTQANTDAKASPSAPEAALVDISPPPTFAAPAGP